MHLKALAPIYANGFMVERGDIFSCNDPVFATALIQNNNAELCMEPDETSDPVQVMDDFLIKMTRKTLLAYAKSIGLTDIKATAAKADIIRKIIAHKNAPPSFKSMVREDNTRVFINVDELGEPHIIKINGKEKVIPLIIDNDELLRRQSQKSIHDDGIFRAQVLLYGKGSDLEVLPDVESLFVLDGKKYRVYDAKDDDGIFVIILERYASRGGL